MSYLTFTNLDWVDATVNDPPAVKNITYVNVGPGTILGTPTFTIDCPDPYAIKGVNTVTFDVFSDWISPDDCNIQNSHYPQYSGDTSNQVWTKGPGELIDNYKDTCLYCYALHINSPLWKTVVTTVTANYRYMIAIPPTPTDPPTVPPPADTIIITDEVSVGYYTIIEKKDLSKTKPQLDQITAFSEANVKRYEAGGKIPL